MRAFGAGGQLAFAFGRLETVCYKGTMLIRQATEADGQAYLALVRGLAEFEDLPPPTRDGEARLLADAFGETPRYELWVVELDEAVVAYAAFFMTYSTFLARPTLYLEDIFVHPDARRRGVATKVLQRLEDLARERDCGRFEWAVLDWNTDAQTLYREIGAQVLESWRTMRKELGP